MVGRPELATGDRPPGELDDPPGQAVDIGVVIAEDGEVEALAYGHARLLELNLDPGRAPPDPEPEPMPPPVWAFEHERRRRVGEPGQTGAGRHTDVEATVADRNSAQGRPGVRIAAVPAHHRPQDTTGLRHEAGCRDVPASPAGGEGRVDAQVHG